METFEITSIVVNTYDTSGKLTKSTTRKILSSLKEILRELGYQVDGGQRAVYLRALKLISKGYSLNEAVAAGGNDG
jgi:hypothetical protein